MAIVNLGNVIPQPLVQSKLVAHASSQKPPTRQQPQWIFLDGDVGLQIFNKAGFSPGGAAGRFRLSELRCYITIEPLSGGTIYRSIKINHCNAK